MATSALDPLVWARVQDVVRAAHAGDRAAFRLALEAMEDDVPSSNDATAWLLYLVRLAICRDGMPTPASVDAVAARIHLRFAVLVPGDLTVVRDALRVCLGHPLTGSRPSRVRMRRDLAAALGSLLDELDDLPPLRRRLEAWCPEHQRRFRDA